MIVAVFWLTIGLVPLLELVSCVKFTFVPQNTILHQPAVYQCTVDTDGVTVQWTVNGSSSTSSSITSLGIITQDVATQNSTLTIPGEATVTCIVSGLVNGEVYANTSCAVFYIQGRTQAGNLMCTSITETLYTECNWTVPYTIEGVTITNYNVKITKDGLLLHQDSVTDTHYSYLSGTYTVSVAAVVGEILEGEVSRHVVNVTKVTMDYPYNVKLMKNNNNEWMANYIIDAQLYNFQHFPMLAGICLHNSPLNDYNCKYQTANITNLQSEMKIVGTVHLEEIQDNEKRKITFIVEYVTGLQVMSRDSQDLSTFDVQRLDITEHVDGRVCFRCTYADGTSAKGCFIEYNCLEHNLSGNLTILRPETTSCKRSIQPSNYTIAAYDHEINGVVDTERPAYLKNTEITGPVPTTATIFSSSLFFSSLNLKSSLGVSSSPSLSTHKGINKIAIIGSSVATLTVLLVIIIIVCIVRAVYVHKLPKTTPNVTDHVNPEVYSREPTNFNYPETVINPNGPKQALSINRFFPYSTVAHQSAVPMSQENYSKLSHCKNPTDKDTYNTLQHTKCSTVVINSSPNYSSLVVQQGNQIINVSDNTVSRGAASTPEITLKYIFVASQIASCIPHKWKEFGAALAITPKKLNEIQENNQSDYRRFCDVVQEWQTSEIRPFTKEILSMILNTIGELQLMEKASPVED